MAQSYYQLWHTGKAIGVTGFEESLFNTYLLAFEKEQKRMEETFPEYFKAPTEKESESIYTLLEAMGARLHLPGSQEPQPGCMDFDCWGLPGFPAKFEKNLDDGIKLLWYKWRSLTFELLGQIRKNHPAIYADSGIPNLWRPQN